MGRRARLVFTLKSSSLAFLCFMFHDANSFSFFCRYKYMLLRGKTFLGSPGKYKEENKSLKFYHPKTITMNILVSILPCL